MFLLGVGFGSASGRRYGDRAGVLPKMKSSDWRGWWRSVRQTEVFGILIGCIYYRKGKKYRVVGVWARFFVFNLDDMVYVPLRTFQKRIIGVDYITFAVAKMRDRAKTTDTTVNADYARTITLLMILIKMISRSILWTRRLTSWQCD